MSMSGLWETLFMSSKSKGIFSRYYYIIKRQWIYQEPLFTFQLTKKAALVHHAGS